MPIIDVTLEEKPLSDEALAKMPESIGQIALRYEGLEGSKFAESFTWVFTHELPQKNSTQVSGKPAKPLYRLEFTTLHGLLDQTSKHKLASEVAKALYELEGSQWDAEEAYNRIWIFFKDVREGDWVVGDRINSLPSLSARVEAEKSQ